MSRKDSGKFGFKNFGLFNWGESLASSSGADPGTISLPQQDAVYLYQLQHSNPCAWTGETLHVSKIIDNDAVSQKVFERLQKLKLLTSTGEVDTAAFDSPTFGKDYTHTLAIIPVSKQKQIVEFIFWWDGETRRLQKLIAEREELLKMQNTGQDVERLQKRIELKINSRPSARDQRLEMDEDLTEQSLNSQNTDMPPAYS